MHPADILPGCGLPMGGLAFGVVFRLPPEQLPAAANDETN